MQLTLAWTRIFSPDRVGNVAWSRKAPGEEFPLHDHDFPEVFWISEGNLRHEINGVATDLTCGHLVFVRPHDRHGFRGIGEQAGTVCNFATRSDVAAHLRQRYFADWSGGWWHRNAVPIAIALTAGELHTLNQAAREFATIAHPDLHATERFLLNLFHVLRQHGRPPRIATEPAWLTRARGAMSDPRHLMHGVPRLVRLAGCSPEHLARTVRRVHGVTPTELVNQLRLAWAGTELQYSSREITEIALAAGFESLSHFYHLFRRQHGVPPRQFRVRARSLA